MIEKERIKEVIKAYEKNDVVTEQEVRSKLLVPIIEALGYKPELRAEEFPVYGFVGGKKLPAKKADFILFSDNSYNKHRLFVQEDIDWVQNHSLLVIEAKRPGELSDIDGQAQFYAMWTRTPAYIVSDGVEIRGYYLTIGISDINYFSCKISELDSWIDKIISFSFAKLAKVKDETQNLFNSLFLKGDYLELRTIAYKDSYVNKLREKQSVFNLMNFKIKDKYVAKIYLDEDVSPIFEGYLYTHLEKEKTILFESEYLDYYIDFNVFVIPVYDYHVLDKSVDERIRNLTKIKKFFSAKKMRIVTEHLEDIDYYFVMPIPKEELTRLDFWLEEMGKIKEIEDYYNIRFKLQWLEDENTLRETYWAIECVYSGIVMQNNCFRIMMTDKQPPEVGNIYKPFTLEEGDIALDTVRIHEISFKAFRISIVPKDNKIQSIYENGILCLPCCCTFIIDENSEV